MASTPLAPWASRYSYGDALDSDLCTGADAMRAWRLRHPWFDWVLSQQRQQE